MTQLGLHDDRLVIVVDNVLCVETARLPRVVFEEITHAFTHINPARIKLEKLGMRGYALHKEPKTIATWMSHAGDLHLPRGGIGKLRSILDRAGIARRFVDQRCGGNPALNGQIPEHRMAASGQLYDFQLKIVEAAAEVENCFVRAPTGSGKSAGALALAASINVATLIVVHNTGLLKQWIENIEKQLGLERSEIGVIGAGVHRVRPITVAMQQSLCKPEVLFAVSPEFGLLIADELQTAAAKTFMETYAAIPARWRIGMSANERRRDHKEFLIYDLFGECVVDVDQAALVDRGVVHDVEVRVVRSDFDVPWYDDLKQRLREDESTDAGERKALQKDRMQAFNRLVDEMMMDERRQAIISRIVQDECLRQGEQVLILSHRREHCTRNDADASALGVPCGRMVGGAGEDRVTFDASIAGLRSGALRAVAGTYQAIGTGIDLPSVAVGICTTPIANSKDGKPFYQQVRGRLCRKAEGKTAARIWYVWDERVFGREPLRNLVRWNRDVKVLGDDGVFVDGRVWLKREV